MARCRNIKPGFFKNEDLAQCSHLARILFAALWCEADRDGRLEDRPLRLKAEWLPYDNADCDALLSELAFHGFIIRYVVNGLKLIDIPTFVQHQNPHRDEKSRNYPPPPKQAAQCLHDAGTVQTPCEHGSSTEARRLIPSLLVTDSLSLDSCNLIPEELPTEVSDETGDAGQSSATVLQFPTDGKAGKHWSLTEAKVAEYQEAYPSLDVVGECRRALQWLRDNPTKRKTKGGMPAFLTRWLNKAQNSPSRPPPSDQRCRVPTDEELAAWTPT